MKNTKTYPKVAIGIKLAAKFKNSRKSPDLYGENHDFYRDRGFNDGLDKAVEMMCDIMEEDNPNFDRDRFLTAAGV